MRPYREPVTAPVWMKALALLVLPVLLLVGALANLCEWTRDEIRFFGFRMGWWDWP